MATKATTCRPRASTRSMSLGGPGNPLPNLQPPDPEGASPCQSSSIDRDPVLPCDGFPARGTGHLSATAWRRRDRDWRGDPLAIEARYEAELAAEKPRRRSAKWLRRDNLSTRLAGDAASPANHPGGLRPVQRLSKGDAGGLSAGDARCGLLGAILRLPGLAQALSIAARRSCSSPTGHSPVSVHGYEREVGLWLQPRARPQAVVGLAHWRGAIAAAGTAPAHFSLVDAMASHRGGGPTPPGRRRLRTNRVEAETHATLSAASDTDLIDDTLYQASHLDACRPRQPTPAPAPVRSTASGGPHGLKNTLDRLRAACWRTWPAARARR